MQPWDSRGNSLSSLRSHGAEQAGAAIETGIDRYVKAERRRIADFYDPYPMQRAYHLSAAPYNCLGGAAGPGKTLALIMDHMDTCQRFPKETADQVHTLMLRRTQPQLKNTVITRFDEKVPRELYRSFNRTDNIVTWQSGATTKFGSMQHESDAGSLQGQWLKVSFDEMAEFTFKQWNGLNAWNRCPVSPYTTKDGATNPVGVGSPWIRALFVDHVPYDEMDPEQRRNYSAADYGYFPCTYLDNPVYAKDPQFIKNLMSYPLAIRNALMNGSWDLVGGYFQGAYDPAENCFDPEQLVIKPWWKRWISGDWGYEHPAAIYWHAMDDWGVIWTYREWVAKHHDPEQLGEAIVKESYEQDGSMPKFQSFPFSHDAFATMSTRNMGGDPTTIAARISKILGARGLPSAFNAGKNALGREQGMYNMLRREVSCGKNPETGEVIVRRNWMVGNNCPKLKQCLASAPRDPDDVERIQPYLGDDPLQGAGYGIQWISANPGQPNYDQKLAAKIQSTDDPMAKHLLRYAETMKRKAKAEESSYW